MPIIEQTLKNLPKMLKILPNLVTMLCVHLPKGLFTRAAFATCGCSGPVWYGKVDIAIIYPTTPFFCSRMYQMQLVGIILREPLSSCTTFHSVPYT